MDTTTSKNVEAEVSQENDAKETKPVDEMVLSSFKLNKILVPLDFSSISEKALRYAVPFARQFGAKIIVLHVIEPLPYPGDMTYAPVGEVIPIEPAKHRLDAFAKTAIAPELLDRTQVEMGVAFEVIADVARSSEVDLIILTTHGYTGLRRVFLGSTAERVVRHAPCPVLTVREREHEFA